PPVAAKALRYALGHCGVDPTNRSEPRTAPEPGAVVACVQRSRARPRGRPVAAAPRARPDLLFRLPEPRRVLHGSGGRPDGSVRRWYRSVLDGRENYPTDAWCDPLMCVHALV